MTILNDKNQHLCYSCKRVLYFSELIETNQNIDIKILSKLWRSKNIKFYCCSCNYIIKNIKYMPSFVKITDDYKVQYDSFLYCKECDKHTASILSFKVSNIYLEYNKKSYYMIQCSLCKNYLDDKGNKIETFKLTYEDTVRCNHCNDDTGLILYHKDGTYDMYCIRCKNYLDNDGDII